MADIIDGKAIAAVIREEISKDTTDRQGRNPGIGRCPSWGRSGQPRLRFNERKGLRRSGNFF